MHLRPNILTAGKTKDLNPVPVRGNIKETEEPGLVESGFFAYLLINIDKQSAVTTDNFIVTECHSGIFGTDKN